MPQLNRNISVFQTETDIDKKYLKSKNKKYRYRSHLIYPHAKPSSSYVCVYCVQSKSMPDIKCKGSCILLLPVCANHPKILTSEKTKQSFRSVWFEEFPWVCYSLWEDGVYFLRCVLFGHKSVRKSKDLLIFCIKF